MCRTHRFSAPCLVICDVQRACWRYAVWHQRRYVGLSRYQATNRSGILVTVSHRQEGNTVSTGTQQFNTREALLDGVREVRQDLERLVAEVDKHRMEQPGSFGEWSLKDLLAHLTGWRRVTAARLEAALRHEEPEFPWPPHLEEGKGPDAKNDWFFETNREKPIAQVMRESREAFDHVERALAALSDDDLFLPHRFAWLQGAPLVSMAVKGTIEHYRVAHEPEIRAWLEQR